MPPQPYIDDWIRLVVHVRHENSTMLLIYNFKHISGTISETTLTEMCQQFWATHGARIAALMASSYSFILVEATDRDHIGGAYGSFVPTTNVVGAKANDALPANVASCISFKTGLAGRSYRGRQYFFGWVDGDFTGSTLVGSNVVLLSQYAQALITTNNYGTISAELAVASIKLLDLIVINSYSLDSAGDSQRRRLPGRGF